MNMQIKKLIGYALVTAVAVLSFLSGYYFPEGALGYEVTISAAVGLVMGMVIVFALRLDVFPEKPERAPIMLSAIGLVNPHAGWVLSQHNPADTIAVWSVIAVTTLLAVLLLENIHAAAIRSRGGSVLTT